MSANNIVRKVNNFVWKGAWVTSTGYAVNDTVENDGSGYVCTSAHTSGATTEPGVGASWATVWDLFVEGLPEPNLTTATTTNLTGVITGNGSVIGSKANPTGDIVGTTDTQTLTNKTLTAPALTSPTISGAWDGWISAGETWTYASADDPTFTFTVAADVTTKYSAGMKIKLTQGTVKYFIITAVSTYSGGNTTITVYGGTDYDLASSAISANAYSMMKSPQGFPMSPSKWSVSVVNNTNPEAGISQNVWTNLGSLSISMPIGCWSVYFSILGLYSYRNGTTSVPEVTLSTANNSETDKEFTIMFESTGATATTFAFAGTASRTKELLITTKTSYYINFTQGGTGSVPVGCSQRNIRATCAYL